MDFGGGIFSFLQIAIKSKAYNTPVIGNSGDGFNIVKFFLSITAMIFDIIFLIQHFVLYKKDAQKPQMGIEINQTDTTQGEDE